MKKNNVYLNDYLEYLKFQKNYSDYTIQSYQNDIEEFFQYLSRESLNFKGVEYSDLRFYLMYLKELICFLYECYFDIYGINKSLKTHYDYKPQKHHHFLYVLDNFL